MFRKILIANRGEIACRVMDTCRRLGVRTVAVFSDADAEARHVALADEAVRLGPAPIAESYLKADGIIDAARATGAEAIHPGYGFLSENPDFVEAVEAAGLVFVGPSAEAIRSMGLKDAAKRLMAEAGVPVVPGYLGADQDPGHLEVEASAIGYPLLIKAVAGGGGKGMRLVETPEGFLPALERAKSEALGAFGNDAVLLEKFVTTPRHIEVQIFGDGQRAVHLFERDCSLQRRHQKVIEEAPAPGMTAEMRDAMGVAAVRAAEAIAYAGAGTVEFIVDGSDGLRPDGFWFMEMNTRLQVEHPVSEAVTGIDLVEWQLRVASGESLPLAQHDIALSGHAFEARLYAEDAAAGFLPATGTLDHLRFPDAARVETGVREGDTITPFYDPMIAKIITHGATREIALAQLHDALSRTEVAGSVTNLAFLRNLTVDEEFARGIVDTGLIERRADALTARPVPCTRTVALAAIGLAGLDLAAPFEGFALWTPLRWQVEFGSGENDYAVWITVEARDSFDVAGSDWRHRIERGKSGWIVDGTVTKARVVRRPGGVSVFWGNGYHFETTERGRSDGTVSGSEIAAPMPGQVVSVHVSAGEHVEEGQRLAVLEAMKMEHVLRAPRAGVVAAVLTSAGAQVGASDVLVRLQEDRDGDGRDL